MLLRRKCRLDVDLILLDVAKNEDRPEQANKQATPNHCAGPAHPQQHDEAAAEDADEQAVASGGVKTKHTVTRTTARHFKFPETHCSDGRKNCDEKHRGWPGPRHP